MLGTKKAKSNGKVVLEYLTHWFSLVGWLKAVSHWPGDVEDNKPHGSGKVVFHPDDLGGRKYFEGS
jgi:hypothetical protein